jgi:hypothetical protein
VKYLRKGIHKQGCHKVPSCPQHHTLYIYDTPQTPGVYLGLFADDAGIYATDSKEGYVLRKLQQDLNAIEMWCEHWNIKIIKIRLRPSTFLIDLGPLRVNLH